MNVIQWILQVLLAFVFLMFGFVHAFRYDEAKTRRKWIAALPRGLLTFIGICEILGAVGLILPALTGNFTVANSPGGAAPFRRDALSDCHPHQARREYDCQHHFCHALAFVAYGWWVLVPL